jgi:hypothetical protein
MEFKFTKIAILAMGLALASMANAQTFDLSETISGVSVTAHFTGTANGNDITGINNISVTEDGLAFGGTLVAAGFIGGAWTQGFADISIDGTNNNFVLWDAINGNPPHDPYSQDFLMGASGTNAATAKYGIMNEVFYALPIFNEANITLPQDWSVTSVSAVPLPTTVIMFASGILCLGALRGKKKTCTTP